MNFKVILQTILSLLILGATTSVHAEAESIKIGLIGDSTVAEKQGWGPAFAARFSDRVTIWNHAKPGATLESRSKELDVLLRKNPDYVLIEFGHNDMKHYDTQVYSDKLKSYLDRIKKAGATAIVLSSVTRRNFDENGKISPVVMEGRTLPQFAKAAEAVAQAEGVFYVDINRASIEFHNQIGPEESRKFNPSADDITHFNEKGARAIAELVINEIARVVPEFSNLLKR